MRKRVDEPVARERTEHKSTKRKISEVQRRSRLWVWIKRALLGLVVLYAALPFILRLFPGIVQHLVYKHAISYFVDLSRPHDLALNHTANMYLSSEEGVTLGMWHTVPEHRWAEAQGKDLDWYEKSLGDGSPVFIYLHGNTGSRAYPHRIGVAKILSSLGYHALVMDYRGFGDSTGEPTEAGLTTDALYLYNWARARSKGSLVVFWGHSLGTAVSTNTAVKLQEQGNPVDAVILEGAFLKPDVSDDELLNFPHPFLWYYWRFPYIQYFFKDLSKNKIAFNIHENVKKMRTPLLILHSKDDHLAPFWMAEKLYSTAKSVLNSDVLVKLAPFDGSHGYLHNGLYRDPGLPAIIREFVQSLIAKSGSTQRQRL
ncbi:lysophosphatidylserine lipase ABHD12 [Brachyhypopomus gauderio]|uniref:lysophosphatidylserine lipase ABHD12 n=1 Tax=Brachyhypopomus gauderio TaxID=698409 RepID=UPI0040437A32